MLRLILEKELREIIGSRKFAITFGVCGPLILLAFYVGVRNYQVSRAQYEAAVQENVRQMSGQTDWLMVPHHISHHFSPEIPSFCLPVHPIKKFFLPLQNFQLVKLHPRPLYLSGFGHIHL